MRVALVSNTLGLGGAEAALSTLGGELRAGGHEVEIWLLDDVDGPEHDNSLLTVRRNIGAGRGVVAGSTVSTLRRIVAEFRPDGIVAVMNPIAAAVLAVISSANVFYWVQNIVRPLPVRLLEVFAFAAGAKPVALNASVASSILWPGAIDLIPNPAPSPAPATLEVLPPEGWRRGALLNVGRCVPQKDQAFLISAFAVLQRLPTGGSSSLTIVGDGPLQPALRAQATLAGVEQHVHFEGAQRASRYYGGQPFFLLTSRWEGQGVVLAEALARGCPVLARDVDGVRETLGDDYPGLVRTDDPEVFAMELDRWLRDPNGVRLMLKAASAQMRMRFAADIVASSWAQLLDQPRRRVSVAPPPDTHQGE